MKATDLLRTQMTMSKDVTAGLLSSMSDAPLTFPTPQGGNHPTWVAGHLVYAEANLINHMLLGNTNPLLSWKDLFRGGSEPVATENTYPALAELLAKWDEIRIQTLQLLDSLSDEDLDKSSLKPPPGREEIFGTYGKVFSMVVMHPLMHRGQVADARLAAGPDVLMF